MLLQEPKLLEDLRSHLSFDRLQFPDAYWTWLRDLLAEKSASGSYTLFYVSREWSAEVGWRDLKPEIVMEKVLMWHRVGERAKWGQ